MARQNPLPESIAKQLPQLYSQDGKGENAIAFVKYFTPWAGWSWYATEYNPTDRLFFGLVKGHETELGYFSLDELMSITGPFGLYIERDIHFKPQTLAECRKPYA